MGAGRLYFWFWVDQHFLVFNTFEIINFSDNANNLLSAVAFLGIGISVAIAITRYRLFDIDILIRKTLLYGALTSFLALVFLGLVVLLQQILGTLTQSENSPLAIVLSTLAIAALFNPLRLRLQEFIDRRFFRRKYNAEQALETFANSARSETDLELLTDRLVQVVNSTMQPDFIGILWAPEGHQRTTKGAK